MNFRPRHISEEQLKVMQKAVMGIEPMLPRELILVGQIPSGKNNMQVTRTGHHYPKLSWQLWRDEAVYNLMQQWKKLAPISIPIGIAFHYWPGDQRVRDVSGMLDAIFHVLVKANILKDDGLIHDVIWERQALNRKGPKVLMMMREKP